MMLRRLAADVLALLLAATIISSRSAVACTCGPELSLSEALAKADGSFMGTLLSLGIDYERHERVFTFSVVRVFKGSFPKRIRIKSSASSCGTSFARDATYLVFTTLIDDVQTTDQCSGNRLVRNAPDWERQLGPGTSPKP